MLAKNFMHIQTILINLKTPFSLKPGVHTVDANTSFYFSNGCVICIITPWYINF